MVRPKAVILGLLGVEEERAPSPSRVFSAAWERGIKPTLCLHVHLLGRRGVASVGVGAIKPQGCG